MKTLQFRIGGERFDRWLSWVAGFALLTTCSTLVLKALPDLGLALSSLLVGGLGLAWVILGQFIPVRVPAVKHPL